MSPGSKFHWKVFVSFYVVFSFVALAVSGAVLYVAPPGRIANWSVWRLALLSKAQWQALHTIVALVFLVAGAFHVYFNWKVLLAYLRSKLQAGLRKKRELAAASLAGVLVLAVSISRVPPFGTIMDVGEVIKNSWAVPATEPPVPHAELMTVQKLSDTVKIPAEKAFANLERQGVNVARPAMTVQEIADANRLTPQQVYQKIQSPDAKPAGGLAQGGGWGRMSVQQVCERSGVPVAEGVARLKAAGIEAEAGSMIRELATSLGKTPIDIARIIAPDDTAASARSQHGSGARKAPETGAAGRR